MTPSFVSRMEQERSAPVRGTRQTTARAVVRRRCERSAVEAPLWRWRACKEGAIRSTRHKVVSGLRSGRLLWAAGWLYYRCRSHRYYPRHLCPRYCERHRVRRITARHTAAPLCRSFAGPIRNGGKRLLSRRRRSPRPGRRNRKSR